MVADQDTDNLRRIQRGLRASKKPGVTLVASQESRLRHYHATVDGYMARQVEKDGAVCSTTRRLPHPLRRRQPQHPRQRLEPPRHGFAEQRHVGRGERQDEPVVAHREPAGRQRSGSAAGQALAQA